ncbi:MAG TPA: hypothetical protein VFF20_07335 [Pseudogracilibacillus sp.]|nr:hypothetical protein [Pseudogracilibacillus sp.]
MTERIINRLKMIDILVAFIMIAILFPKVPAREGESIDWLGSIFLTITITALLLAFSFAGSGPGEYAWTSFQILGLFGITLLALLAFIITETKVKSPVLPLSLFKNDIVTFSNIALFLLSAGMMGVMIYAPFFIQGVKGVSPSGSGFMMMPMSIVMVFSLTVQNAVPLRELGVASASSQLFRNLGNTIGVGILGSVMSSRMGKRMAEMASHEEIQAIKTSPWSDKEAEQFGELMNPEVLLDQPKLQEITEQMPADMVPIANELIDLIRGILSDALTTPFLAGAFIMLLGVVVAMFVRAIPLVSAKDPEIKSQKTEDKRGTPSF